MNRTHDTHDTDDMPSGSANGEMVYAGRFGDDELTDEERGTLQTAFAALVRAGRPLFGPVPEEGAGALIDPADPGLNTRVSAILNRDVGPRLLESDDAGDEDHGDGVAALDELDRRDPELDIAEVDALMVPDDEADAGDGQDRDV